MINILNERFSNNNITIGVENLELAKFFSEDINWVDYKTPYKSNFFIYGGGGQFFSFDDGKGRSADLTDKGFYYKAKSFLKNNKNIYNALLRLVLSQFNPNENLVISKNTASFSIGMGPFDLPGKGLDRLIDFSDKVDFCSVRDSTSANYFNKYSNQDKRVHVFIDPTFNDDDWFSKNSSLCLRQGEYITYIVRDWPYTKNGSNLVEIMIEHARFKKSQGFKVRLCALFVQKDEPIIQRNQDLEWLLYDLNTFTIETFMKELLEGSKYICSARAHGVWLPTILGFPVLAAGIENKLYEVHKSLEDSSILTSANSVEEFDENFKTYTDSFDSLKMAIPSVIKAKKEKAQEAKTIFLNWIDEKLKNE